MHSQIESSCGGWSASIAMHLLPGNGLFSAARIGRLLNLALSAFFVTFRACTGRANRACPA
jgi:hypothetical protein